MPDNARLDNDRVRFPGSGSAVTINTVPYGFFLNESVNSGSAGYFEGDCYRAMIQAARLLGYGIIDIELVDLNFYAAFEKAVLEYGEILNEFNIRNNILSLQGMPVSNAPNVTGLNVQGSGLPYVINIAKQYGSEIGVGGNVEIKKYGLHAIQGQQVYDLQNLIGNTLETGSRVEIRRIFHYMPPAFARIYDPFSMTGMSYSNVLNEMGFAGYSPATQFLMTPIFEDLLRGQAIEFNDEVRKSAYSFEVANNKLKLFPIPTYDCTVYLEYVVEKDKYAGTNLFSSGSNYDVVSDFSNVPYQNPVYYKLNAPSKQWIRNYFVALCKETLGIIRQKYNSIPLSGDSEITLDGPELRSEAANEKELLVTKLREDLEASGKKAQMEAKADEARQMNEVLRYVPTFIYCY